MKKLLPLALGLVLSAPGLTAWAQTPVRHGGIALNPSVRLNPRATLLTEDVTSPRQSYDFFPIGANVYDDAYLQNYVDLDISSPGVLDWSGNAFTFDGATGEDVILRSFAEENIGVPVFAALDGTVVQSSYTDPNDHVTTGGSGLGNYVLIDHGSGQQTGYFSLAYGNGDPRYSPVQPGQSVRAGTQIGLVGSSGISTGPHLHLQSSLNGAIFEPFAGPARPGPSWWVAQSALRSSLYVEVFNVDAGNVTSPTPSADFPRQGTFLTGSQNTGCWAILHNLPPNSTFRLRWLRPDASVYHDTSGTLIFTGSSTFQRTLEYFWNYNWDPGLDQIGTWHLELSLNGQVIQTAPFRVVANSSQATARPPYNVTAALDPAQPTASDAVFCRVQTTPGQDGAPVVVDPDSNLVYYHYRWTLTSGGATRVVREVDSAGHADAIPWGQGNAGDALQCTVTPVNSKGTSGQPATAHATLGARKLVRIAEGSDGHSRLLWTMPSGLAYLWNVDASGSHTDFAYGPIPGWTATDLAVGTDNVPHILWTSTAGQMSVWTVNPDGTITSTAAYGPYSGWATKSLGIGADNIPRVLWSNVSGQFSVWSLNGDGSVSSTPGYGPIAGWSPTSLAVGPDKAARLLLNNTSGQAAIWRIDASGNVTSTPAYGPIAGWSAVGLGVGGDNNARLQWKNVSGETAVWTVTPDGNITSTPGYGPIAGWSAVGLGIASSNQPRVVWAGDNGQAAIWTIDPSGSVTSTKGYGL